VSWGSALTIKVLGTRVGKDISFLVFAMNTDTPCSNLSAFKIKTKVRGFETVAHIWKLYPSTHHGGKTV